MQKGGKKTILQNEQSEIGSGFRTAKINGPLPELGALLTNSWNLPTEDQFLESGSGSDQKERFDSAKILLYFEYAVKFVQL